MAHASLDSCFGMLTLFEEEGFLVALEWGRASESEHTPVLQAAIGELQAYFDGQLQAFSLPMRTHGSPFQRRVWSRLTAIPYGRTVTYASLAGEIGTSPRAVARACATNPLPVLVPCHRVVAAHGGLGGYSGGDGIETKRALLRLEGIDLAFGAPMSSRKIPASRRPT
jgi:methylated-DNA-[protein]-cysteine S-methyltransferase